MTVVICDTEPVAMAGLQSLLENVSGVSVLAAENSISAGMKAVSELSPTLVIVDKALGSQPVFDWIAGLRVSHRGAAVLVWGALSEAEAVRFLQAGVSGIVRKSASLQTLLRCILALAAGSAWVDESLLPAPGRSARASNSPLSAREGQVMELVERGFKNKEIGANLGIQTGTVKIHLKHIFEKTGIRGRYSLALSGFKEKASIAADAAASPN